MATNTTTVSAVVAYNPSDFGKCNFKYTTLELVRQEPGPGEVLVRFIASGICHTDIYVGGIPEPHLGPYPKVLGHEGSGFVEAVGSAVTSVAVGDPVLLSYNYCNECDLCTSKQDGPVYCEKFFEANILCPEHLYKGSDGTQVGAKFFGQSSYANLGLVDEKCLVNVKALIRDNDELKLFSPLGCGLMTGSGAVLNAAQPTSNDTMVIAGLGAVGLAAVMAGKIAGCKAIIAVDRVKSRMDLAKQLGATHVFDTAGMDVTADSFATDFSTKVRALVGGDDAKIKFAFDTTGLVPLMDGLIRTMTKRGVLYQIGVPVAAPVANLTIDMAELFNNTKRIETHFLGKCLARDHVPKMIQWYREGKFAFDKLVKFYPAKDVEQAVEEMKTEVIKPILVH